MQRLLWLMMFAFFAVYVQAKAEVTPLKVGDRVVVVSGIVPVYVRPNSKNPLVTEILPGMVSRIVDIKSDELGIEWMYLENNAFGWIMATQDGKPTLELYKDHMLDGFIREATKRIETDSKNLDAHIRRATAYLSQKQFDQAIADYNTVITLAPESANLQEYLGKAHLDARNYHEALGYFDEARRLGSTLPGLQNRTAIALERQGAFSTATKIYLQAIADSPSWGLLYSNLATTYFKQGYYDLAISYYEIALQYDTDLSMALVNRGTIFAKQNNFDQALKAFQAAIELDPTSTYAYIMRGKFYYENYGDFKTARDNFRTAIQIDPYNDRAYEELGYTYFYENRDIAFANYQIAIELNPANDNAHYNLGSLYALSGQLHDALEQYLFVKRTVDPNDTLFFGMLLYRAQVYSALRYHQNAVSDMNDFLQYRESHDDTTSQFYVVGHLVRGNIYLFLQQYDKAMLDFQASFEAQSEFTLQYYWYGTAYRLANVQEDAIKDLKARLVSEPDHTELHLKLANQYMEQGQWVEALISYDQYLETQDNPELAAFVKDFNQLWALNLFRNFVNRSSI